MTTTNNRVKFNHSSHLTPVDKERLAEPNSNPEVPTKESKRITKFEQPFILQQSPVWSRAILWVLMGAITGAVIWACFAKIESAIPAQGQLEPQGAVKDIQAPVNGVVKAIYVEDGQKVQQGEKLVSLEPTADQAQLASLEKIRTALTQENQFYRTQMSGLSDSAVVQQATTKLKLPPELVSLTESRAALLAENKLYRTQLSGSNRGNQLTPEQLERLQSNQAELGTRVKADQLEVGQLTKQLRQSQIQVANARETLAMNQEILKNIEPLTKQGAMSRLQYLKQKQEVNNSKSELDQQIQEQQRLQLEIGAAQSKLQNTVAVERKDILDKIAENDKAIAQIDSELTKAILDNNKEIAELDSQLSKTQQTLRYQELEAPVAGTVFDLQAHAPGYVTNSTAPILKIVPDDNLTAKVYITNRDIGFIKEGMKVDVRIDSFPFSEFGDVKGELVSIGSDALPPDETRKFYSFPAKIRLDRQTLLVSGREVPLQSGMSVNANIKVRERTVMSIFTDMFTQSVESLKTVR